MMFLLFTPVITTNTCSEDVFIYVSRFMNESLFYLIVDEFVTCWSGVNYVKKFNLYLNGYYNVKNVVYEQLFID